MDLLSETLATEGLWLLVVGITLAGLVRGFSGFGTAMVYMPFAAQVLPPVWVMVTLLIINLFGPLVAVPRALRDGHPRDVLRLGAGALVGVPLGVVILVSLAPEVFRYSVSIMALVLLALMVGGFRYRGRVSRPMIYATGALGGVFGGAIGLPGPPVILLYMARPLPPQVIRANTLLYLIAAHVLIFAVFALQGLLVAQALMLGAVLTVPYFAAVAVGSAMFDPGAEKVYRRVSYAIIAIAAVMGLPLWD